MYYLVVTPFEVISASIVAESVVNERHVLRINDSGAEFRGNLDAVAVDGHAIHERAHLAAGKVMCTCCTLDHADFVIFERRSVDGCQEMIECARFHAVNGWIMRWHGRCRRPIRTSCSAIGGADTPNLHRLSGVADTPMPVMVRLATTAFESGGCARRAMLGCVIVNA